MQNRMKRTLFILASISLVLTSCEHDKSGYELDPGDTLVTEDPAGHDLLMKIGDNITFDYSDIELYDSSTHIFYFRELHPEFDKIKQVPFQFYVKGDTIYKGDFWPTYYSSHPAGPFITNYPLLYQNYVLRIENRYNYSPDPRNDPRLIQALKNKNLLHSGLSLRISSIVCTASQISFSFDVTNYDKDELLILDPDKTGLGIFHYFTNGLYIRKLPGTTTTNVKIAFQTPSPWNGWHKEWFYKLSPGETKGCVIDYPISSPLEKGEYEVKFEYPGLSYQVSAEQLYQTNGRIWLGDIEGSYSLVIK